MHRKEMSRKIKNLRSNNNKEYWNILRQGTNKKTTKFCGFSVLFTVFSSSCTPGSHGSASGLNFIERDIGECTSE
jgi:hypothetical protein